MTVIELTLGFSRAIVLHTVLKELLWAWVLIEIEKIDQIGYNEIIEKARQTIGGKQMIKTILFDLDGTLLPLDMDLFVKKYFYELGIKFKDYFRQEELVSNIWASTKYMVENEDENKTNAEAFFEDFYGRVQYDEATLNPLFDEFYANDFRKIKETTKQNEYIIESITMLKNKGYKMVVATNPLFPESAILQRVEWAGLDKEDFAFITSFEKMHFCKPQIRFYEEILKNIGDQPEDCLMVGNDIKEDMIAKRLGIKTYLIQDHIIGDLKEDIHIDYKGNYRDFYDFVKQLPEI